MKTSTFLTRAIFSTFMMLGLLSSLLVVGQQPNKPSADTTAPKIEVIKLSEISIKSGEVWTQTSRLYESLLPDEDIDKMKIKNDSVVDHIKSLLNADLGIDLNGKNVRYLNNKKVYWKKYTAVLDAENSTLASNIKTLNEHKQDIEEEILVWENTLTALNEEDAESTVIKRVVELISQLEGVVAKVQKKNDKLLAMLDRTTEVGVTMVEHIDRIDKELVDKKDEIFVKDQPPLYATAYGESHNWNFKDPILFFYQVEVVELGKYVKDSYQYFAIQLLLIIVLIVVFGIIKKRILKADIYKNTIYRQMLVKILTRNVSAALVVGLFASILIFPNRPELFKDISILIVVIPLLIIVSTLVERKFYRYLYLFGVLIYLRMVYTIFAPDNLYSTATMIVVGIIEIYSLWKLMVYFYKHPMSRKLFSNLLILLIVVNMGFAIVGILGVVFGATMLAQMTLGIPISYVLSGILIFITAVIFNGLIDIGIENPHIQKLNFVRLYGYSLRRKSVSIINFTAVIYWISIMLTAINIRKPILDGVVNFFTDKIEVGKVSFTLWDIVLFFLVIWMSAIISKMIRILLEKDILNNLRLDKGVPHTIAMMVRYAIITIGVILAIAAAGVPVDKLTVLIGAFGVGIGFGLQSIFNNLVSGFILLLERPIQIGDTIEVGTLIGSVKTIGIRASNVRTFDGAEVIVPNGQLISTEVVNWTLSDQSRRIEIIAGVAYGSDPHKAKKLLLNILEEHPDVINDPEPMVLFNALGESSLDFRMLFWTSVSSEWIRIRSEVMFGVHDILKKEGIAIPFPQMDLHLRSIDEGVEIVSKVEK